MLVWGTNCFMPLVNTFHNLYLAQHLGVQFTDLQAASLILLGISMIYVNYASDVHWHVIRAKKGGCELGFPFKGRAKVIVAKYKLANKQENQALLVVNEYYGLMRHFHYLPDLVFLLLYCMPTGKSGLIPYMYFVYLTSLLVDRVGRIELRMEAKTQGYWEEYKALVKYRLIPFVY